MIGRRMRDVGLLLAAWALVFAPGALGPGGDAAPALDAGAAPADLAAAVIAPTFGSDALSVARSARDEDIPADGVPDVQSAALLLGVLAAASERRPLPVLPTATVRDAPAPRTRTRAPPAG